MKIPLSDADVSEILVAYKKVADDLTECADSMEVLLKVLEQRMACVDPSCKKDLSEKLQAICSSMFKLGAAQYKLKNHGLEGREFKPA